MEFKLVIHDVNETPLVLLDGKKYPIMDLEIKYESSDHRESGVCKYLVRYVDEGKVKTIGFARSGRDI